jgi:hypothetical protein
MKLQDSITDPQNTLSDKKTQLYDSIKEVKNKTNQNLWIIFVPSFDGITEDINKDGAIDANDWVDSVAKTSNLGVDDIVLAVATTKHEMVVYVSSESHYLKQKNLDIITNATMVSLQQGEWGKAALKFCESVQRQILSSDSKIGYFIVIPLFLTLVGYLVFSMVRRIKKEKEIEEIAKYEDISSINLQPQVNGSYITTPITQSAYAVSNTPVQYSPNLQYNAQNSSLNSNNLQNTWSSSYSSSPTSTEQYLQLQSQPLSSAAIPVATSASNDAVILNNYTTTRQNEANYSESFNDILQEIESSGKNYTTTQNTDTSNLTAMKQKSTSKFRLDALYDQYGISKDNVALSTPTASASARSVSTKEIYGDYYTRSASRFLYGSYYSDGQAAKHDKSVNEANAHLNDAQTIYQPIGIDTSTNVSRNHTRSSQELYNKYYSNESRGFLDRFKK